MSLNTRDVFEKALWGPCAHAILRITILGMFVFEHLSLKSIWWFTGLHLPVPSTKLWCTIREYNEGDLALQIAD